MKPLQLWERYKSWLCVDPDLGFRLDVSRMDLPDDYAERMGPAMSDAFDAMEALEGGAIANPDEQRMVGHYWLRSPQLSPSGEIRTGIEATLKHIEDFTDRVHGAVLRPSCAECFRNLLVVGIGGSALGPQFVAGALGSAGDRMQPHFLDNTDPDGIDRLVGGLGGDLRGTLCIVISKSGGTPETRNGMLEARAAYQALGLDFGGHAVAITQEGSRLDRFAIEHNFIERFPMWDWVGGRTSVMSAVGLLPAALQGIDIRDLLDGAAAMDRTTRRRQIKNNPAALLALAWFHAGEGRGRKDMVILPYKDRLALFSRYLQQLVMESLGKEKDLDGKTVHQGIAVYGNKGSTDQHAYVQQLREGVPNFFVTFIEVLRDRENSSIDVEDGTTSGDFLHGFLLGTRRALYDNGRPSMTLTLERVDPRGVGMLIALYERAVGFYASLVHVNAYHQPGVEAGKKAAAAVIELQHRLVAELQMRGHGGSCEELAAAVGRADEVETVFLILEHLVANPDRGIEKETGSALFDSIYRSRRS